MRGDDRLGIGASVGRYRIERHLGSGGMGDVYVAEDTTLRRRVALKVMSNASAGAAERARFIREGQAVAALSHPNIVVIFDVGHEGDRLFLAMQYIEGTPLREAMTSGAPEAERIGWLLEIARALAAAHRAGIVHRDVKPENVILDDAAHAHVLDFGIASLRADANALATTEARLTAPNAAIGTPAYMAPEQVRGDVVDGRADQFAWGVVAYEVLSGRHPFAEGATTVPQVVSAILEKAPPPWSAPHAMEHVIDRALAKAPEDRFASFDELLRALEEPKEATTAIPLQRRVARKRRRWPLAAAFVALALVAAVAFVATRKSTEKPVARAPDASDAPTTITMLPIPESASSEARAEFRKALQSFHDANWELAATSLEKAVKADPGMAAAHLRLAIYGRYAYANDPVRARKSFDAASQLRTALTPRDLALLEAQAPYFLVDPPDAVASAAKLTALSDQFPHDAELALYAAYEERDVPRRLALIDRAVEADPTYADALQMRAHVLRVAKRDREADESLDKCLAIVPASQCLEDRILSRMDRGDCSAMEVDARAWVTGSGGTPMAHQLFAAALMANARSEATVTEALSHRWDDFHEDGRATRTALEKSALAVAYGRFAEAESLALGVMASTDITLRKRATRRLVEIARESGRLDVAAKRASQFLDVAAAWSRPGQLDELTPLAIEVLREAGALSASAARAKLDAWVSEQQRSVLADAAPQVAITGYSGWDPTPEIAKDETANLPDTLPNRAWVSWSYRARFARTRFLAGKSDGVVLLRAAANNCAMLYDPMTFVHAKLWLGEALEATNDRTDACSAYAAVIERWGTAKPASVSANEARRRSKALACP